MLDNISVLGAKGAGTFESMNISDAEDIETHKKKKIQGTTNFQIGEAGGSPPVWLAAIRKYNEKPNIKCRQGGGRGRGGAQTPVCPETTMK